MATAAALFKLVPNVKREIILSIPLIRDAAVKPVALSTSADTKWNESLKGLCEATLPDKHFQFLYDAAIRSLILHSPEQEIYPGPYTYKRFWFRDAAFILEAMLCVGLSGRVKKIVNRFPERQTSAGYFLSQDGEWDSNGEALWAIRRLCELTGWKPDPKLKSAIYKAAKWIQIKRVFKKGSRHCGLLPVGFSAEHLGPNDYYYWDDFWGVSGLEASAYLAKQFGDDGLAAQYLEQAGDFLRCIEASLRMTGEQTKGNVMPASPHRRMDAGAIGSLVAGYPLQIFSARDPRLLNTAAFLFHECFVHGGFYQEISHSGINAYLTLHMAQIFLRAGDPRFFDVLSSVASLATSTGQWPEAVHPRTKGGCMGDGQHIWAAAEWILMIRNCFVREEKDKLILFSGIPKVWLESEEEIKLGPAPTQFGAVQLSLKRTGERIKFTWIGQWFGPQPRIEVHFCGLVTAMEAGIHELELTDPRAAPLRALDRVRRNQMRKGQE